MTLSSLEDVGSWRLATAGGIPYRILETSGSFEVENAEASESYIIRATDLLAFVLESYPAPFVQLSTVIYPQKRRMPGFLPMVSRRISYEAFIPGKPIDPFNTDPTAPDGTYGDFAKVRIDYSTSPANDSAPDSNNALTFLEVTANASGEFLNTPVRSEAQWVLSTGNEPVRDINIPQTITVPEVEWNVRWSQIPYGFFNATLMGRLRAKLGTVNSSTMSLFFNSPQETVLFVGWSMRQQFTWRTGVSGQPPMELELKFLEKNFIAPDGTQVTHNHFYKPATGFRKLLIDGTDPVYDSSNLDQIFLP